MTREEALSLCFGQTIYHIYLRNADKTPVRARITGRPKTYIRNPSRWYVPAKYGLKTHFRLSEENIEDWQLSAE